MPTYEFACRDCAERVEVRASIAEKEAGLSPECPACGAQPMRRLLSTFATRSTGVPQTVPAPVGGGGGCCGSGCCT